MHLHQGWARPDQPGSCIPTSMAPMNEWWREYGEYHQRSREIDLLDQQAEAEAEAVWKLLRLTPGAVILDAPCGFGRHAVRLAAWGFSVLGIDLDEFLLEEAKSRAQASGVSLQLQQGDLRSLPVEDNTVDAVLNLATSIGLFADDRENMAVLREAHRVLRPGGKFLIETMHRDMTTIMPENAWEIRPDDTIILKQGQFDIVSGQLHSKLTVVAPDGTRSEFSRHQQIYSLTKLVETLQEAGFCEVHCYGGLGEIPPTPHEKAVLVAEKS